MKHKNVLVTSATARREYRMPAIQPSHPVIWKYRSGISILLVLVVAVLLTTACAVKLIGDYDATIDQGITDVQQKAELYLSKLESTPNTPYDQSFYDDMNS